jgi:hypothetical protein
MPKASPEERAEWACAEFERKSGDVDSLLDGSSEPPPTKDDANNLIVSNKELAP